MMYITSVKRILVSIYVIILLILVGFMGLLLFDGINDNFGVDAATTHYVGGSGPGNFSSIVNAITAASEGDTIRVFNGTYFENNILIAKTISLIGNGSANTTIDAGGSGDVIKITADWANVSGFKIANSGSNTLPPGDAGIELDNVENVTISNNNCSNNNYGIYLYNSGSNYIMNNTCFGNIYDGIHLITSDSNSIENNRLNLNRNNGASILDSSSNIFNDNKCKYNDKIGIWFYNSDRNDVLNNICDYNNWSGLRLEGSDENTILNNYCNHNDNHGILLYQSSDLNIVDNNDVDSNNVSSIRISSSSSNKIVNNSCDNNNYFGIYLTLADSNILTNNTCNNNIFDGIHLEFSDDTTLIDNTCDSIYGYAIYIWASISNTISNNIMTSGGFVLDGVLPEYYNSHMIDTSNLINGKPIYYWKFQTSGTIPSGAGQVILANCSNIQISGQEMLYSSIGIEVAFSDSISITNNDFSNNFYSMLLLLSDNNIIEGNIFDSNIYHGIRLYESNRNNISNNSCSLNEINGIHMYSSSNNTLYNNTVSNNNENGIYLYESKGNKLMFNTITGNDINGLVMNFTSNKNSITNNHFSLNNQYGITIWDSNNNKVYFNNFVDNTNQAHEVGDNDNQWDDGAEGNYWSDYTGLDNGAGARIAGDGIGDTNIPHLGLDKYPFMNRSGWLYPGIPRLNDPGEFDTDGNYTLSWPAVRGTISYTLEEDLNSDFSSSSIIYAGSERNYDIIHKPNGTYYYRIKAHSMDFASPWSNVVDITVDWPPDRPQNFEVTPYPEGNALNISWAVNIVDTIYYDLFYKTDTIPTWKSLDSIFHPESTFNHTGLQDGLIYYYRLQARDARDQKSDFTTVKSGIPKDTVRPVAPTSLQVIAQSYDSITLLWSPNLETDVLGYKIYLHSESDLSGPGDLIGNTSVGTEEFIHTGLKELTTYYYSITAFDEVNESERSKVRFNTTLKGPLGSRPPEVNDLYLTSLGKVTLDEDTSKEFAIDLNLLFIDPNGDKLKFNATYENNITIDINDDGTVTLTPKENWNGEVTVTFSASDNENTTFVNITITVTAKNDPPGLATILSPKDETEIKFGEKLDFEGDCDDPDGPDDTLTFNWSSRISGPLGSGRNLTDIKLEPGVHRITLEVRDKAGATSYANITITVLEKTDSGFNTNLLITSISGIIIVIILIIILFVLLKKKRESKEGEEVQDVELASPPPSPTSQPEQVEQYIRPEMIPSAASPEPSALSAEISEGIPQPQALSLEPGTPVQPITIDFGGAYIILTKGPEFGLQVFETQLSEKSGIGMLIVREHPSKLKSSPIMDTVTPIWLSKTPDKDSISPGNITKIAHVITEFVKANEKSVVLLDGLEYLINNNDFPRILKFLELLHEVVVLNNGILLVPVNPLTLAKTDFELLENELTNIINDPVYSAEVMG